MSDPASDIVLITIDCWRYDAPDRMSEIHEFTERFSRSECITHAPATDGSIPGLLSSLYYPQAYDEKGEIKNSVRSLPEMLSESGYSTAAFSAANPFLGKWERFFDTFWNGDFTEPTERNTILQGADYASRLLALRQKFPAAEIGKRARGWYQDQSDPRFLWIHLMDLHEPFHPGLKRGLDTGLLRSYCSLMEYRFGDERTEDTLSDVTQRYIEQLYWKCVDSLDSQIADVLDWIDEDATVVITGDHGEEFHHGVYRHARLYDECVRVPLFIRTDLDLDSTGAVHRQLDIAPTLLHEVGIDPPEAWEGTRITDSSRPAFLLSHVPQLSSFYAGLRNENFKLIESFDEESGQRYNTEFFDLHADPNEEESICHPKIENFHLELDEFLNRIDVDTRARIRGPVDTVEQRLEELGYRSR